MKPILFPNGIDHILPIFFSPIWVPYKAHRIPKWGSPYSPHILFSQMGPIWIPYSANYGPTHILPKLFLPRWAPYLTHMEPIWVIWVDPYGSHLELGCRILRGPYWFPHMGPIFWPIWDPCNTHMGLLPGYAWQSFNPANGKKNTSWWILNCNTLPIYCVNQENMVIVVTKSASNYNHGWFEKQFL